MEATVTIVSSIEVPSAKRNANNEIKFIVKPKNFIKIRPDKNVNGIVREAKSA